MDFSKDFEVHEANPLVRMHLKDLVLQAMASVEVEHLEVVVHEFVAEREKSEFS